MTPKDLRPEVLAFAYAMEKKLRANDHKGGWKGSSAHLLLARVCDELVEVVEELRVDPAMERSMDFATHHLQLASSALRLFGPGRKPGGKPGLHGECADVANMIMMVADVCAIEKAEEK